MQGRGVRARLGLDEDVVLLCGCWVQCSHIPEVEKGIRDRITIVSS